MKAPILIIIFFIFPIVLAVPTLYNTTFYEDQMICGYDNTSTITSYNWSIDGTIYSMGSNPILLYCPFDSDMNCSKNITSTHAGIFNSTSGKYGGGFDENGYNGYFQVGNMTQYTTISGNLTISAWIKIIQDGQSNGTIISGVGTTGGYLLSISGNKLYLQLKDGANNAFLFLGNPNMQWHNNTWYWIAVTFTNSTTTNNVRAYRDGALLSSGVTSTSITPAPDATRNLDIGGYLGGALNGTIDDLIVENRYYDDRAIYYKYEAATQRRSEKNMICLTPAEIQGHHNITFINATANITAYVTTIFVNTTLQNQTTIFKYGTINWYAPQPGNSSIRPLIQALNLDYISMLTANEPSQGYDSRCFNGSVFNFSTCDDQMNMSYSITGEVWIDQFGYPTGVWVNSTSCPNITNDKYGQWYGGIIRHMYLMSTNGSWQAKYGYALNFSKIKWTHIGEPSLSCYWTINDSSNQGKQENAYTPLIFQIHNQTVRNLTDIGTNGINYSLGYDMVLGKYFDYGPYDYTDAENVFNMTPRPAFVAMHTYANQWPLYNINPRDRYWADAHYPIIPEWLRNYSYYLFYETPLWERSWMNTLNYSNTTEIYAPELNQHTDGTMINQTYNGWFLATALYYYVANGETSGSTIFTGGMGDSTDGFSIIDSELHPKPEYYVIKNYKYCFPKGTKIFYSTSSDGLILSMWGNRSGRICGIIINEHDAITEVTLNFSNTTALQNLQNNSELLNSTAGLYTINIGALEYKFFEETTYGNCAGGQTICNNGYCFQGSITCSGNTLSAQQFTCNNSSCI